MKWATEHFSRDSLFVSSILTSHRADESKSIRASRECSSKFFNNFQISASEISSSLPIWKSTFNSNSKPVRSRTFLSDKHRSRFTVDYLFSSTDVEKVNCHINKFLKSHAAWVHFNLLSCSWIWIIWWDYYAHCYVVVGSWRLIRLMIRSWYFDRQLITPTADYVQQVEYAPSCSLIFMHFCDVEEQKLFHRFDLLEIMRKVPRLSTIPILNLFCSTFHHVSDF